MVHKIARKYSSVKGVQYDDLISEGKLGVYIAKHSYNPSKRSSLSTWTYNNIRWRMLTYIRYINKDQVLELKPSEIENVTDPNHFTEEPIIDYSKLFKDLSDMEMYIVYERIYNNRKFTEIAHDLDKDPREIRKIFHKSMSVLRLQFIQDPSTILSIPKSFF